MEDVQAFNGIGVKSPGERDRERKKKKKVVSDFMLRLREIKKKKIVYMPEPDASGNGFYFNRGTLSSSLF